jgi:glycosyltransferase involved in cell wall biosynthesis
VENFLFPLYVNKVPEGKLPKVTIGLPVHNAGPFLVTCLRSIFSQTLKDWELVIVDDGSGDESVATLEKIGDARVRSLFAKQRQGLAASLNQITSLANGKYIARMDADDLMHPERLERQISFLEAHPEVDGVGCGLIVVGRDLKPMGRRKLPLHHEEICLNPLNGFRLAHATFVGRAGWFRCHPYNQRNHGCEDWELWASSFHNSRFANLGDLLYFYREFDSFRLAKYARKKHEFAARLWSKGRQFGAASALGQCLAQYAHLALYSGAALVGQTDRLLQRRNEALDQAELDSAQATIQAVESTPVPTLDAAIAMNG